MHICQKSRYWPLTKEVKQDKVLSSALLMAACEEATPMANDSWTVTTGIWFASNATLQSTYNTLSSS